MKMENNNQNQNNLEQMEKDINKKFDEALANGKSLEEAEAEVKAMYADVLPKPVNSVYDAYKAIDDIIVKADYLMDQYKLKVENINRDLKDEKQQELRQKFHADFRQDMQKLHADLDRIAKKDAKYKKEAKERNLMDREYKEQRKEALDICLSLGKVLEPDLIEHILTPIVAHEDLMTLRILEASAGPKNKYAFRSAIRKVEQMQEVSDISDYLKEARKYIDKENGEKYITLLKYYKR